MSNTKHRTADRHLRKVVSANITSIMNRRGMTATQLAEKSGTCRSGVHYILNCERTPTVTMLHLLAEALGVTSARLLRGA